MKKFLSLVLALVMTMSLVTVSAGAKDFTDSTKIQYTEAVDVMSAVKVIDGYTDGSFNPTATLTRGAAAKIICNLILGPTTASALVADAAPYKDVPTNHTFAGYIAYCQKEGIISGYADGTFKPANSLTGYAFMKMLLGALGYKAEQEGYTGANWSINVAKRALNIGLDDDLVGSFNGVKAVNREEACLYAFNTLKATMVEYDKNSTVTVGNITIKDTSDAKEVTCTEGKGNDGNIKKDGKVQFAEKYFENLKGVDDTDEFQRPATTWKVKTEKVGTYVKAADVEYSKKVEYGDVYADLGLSDSAKITEYYIDGKEATPATAKVAKKDDDNEFGQKGVLTQVWLNDDNNTVIVTEINTYVGKVGSVTKASGKDDRYITVSAYSTNKPAGLDTKFETEEFAKDDLITYTAAYDKADGTYEIQEVKALTEKATGKLTEWNGKTYATSTGKSENNFTVAGTKYEYSNKVVVVDEDDHTSDIWLFDVNKSEVNVYVDQYGYAIYVSGVEGTKDYAAVIGVGNTNAYGSSKNGATLLFPDGTTKEVRYTMKDGSAALKTPNTVAEKTGEIVTYTVKDDGTYELNLQQGEWTDQYGLASGETDNTKDTKFVNGKSAFTLNGQTYYATSETVFFVITGSNPADLDEDDYEVYTGYANMPGFIYDVDGASSSKQVQGFAVVSDADYHEQAEYVYIYAKDLEGVSDVDTYFVKKKDADIITNSDGSYYVLPAIVDGEATTVKVDATITDVANNSVAGLFAVKNVVKDSKGIITRFTNVTNSTTFSAAYGAAGTVEANKVVLGIGSSKASATYWAYDKDTNVYVVDKKYKTITISSVADVETDANDLVYAIKDKDKVLTDVVIVKQDDAVLSSDTSLKTFKVKGVDVVNGEVTLTNVDMASTTAKRLEVATKNDNATIEKVEWKSASQTTWTTSGFPASVYGVAGDDSADVNWNNDFQIRVTVKAQDGSTDTYTVSVKKSADTYVAVTYTVADGARVTIDGKVIANGTKITYKEGTVVTLKVALSDANVAAGKTATVTYGSAVSGFDGTYDITVNSANTTIAVTVV